MHTGTGQVVELILEDGGQLARISCGASLIPSPGQYVLSDNASDSPLPVPVFYTDSTPEGFIAAPLGANSWRPGQQLYLRGPLGRGFERPPFARRVALIAFDTPPVRLRGLIKPALKLEAAVVLVCDSASEQLPDEVEVQPLSALADILNWADYIAFDVARENLPRLRERLGTSNQLPALRAAQVLVRTLMPCGGVADCGVCAVQLKSAWRLACKEGPVLNWRELG